MSDPAIAGGISDKPETATPIAYEVASEGIAGVVAMRYNIDVETAARFVVRLYDGIDSGGELAQIVSEARCLLASPDWPGALTEAWQLPVFVQNHPLRSLRDPPRRSRADEESRETHIRTRMDGIPSSHHGEVVGQDYALLELDRIFVSENIAMVIGPPESGKTAIAMELARRYAQTGGLANHHARRAATVIIYRDLREFESVDTLCESVQQTLADAGDLALTVDQLVTELTQRKTLMILDLNNDLSERRIPPEKLNAFVRLLVDRGIKILFVARHAGSLCLSEPVRAIQLRYVHSGASYAMAAKWLAKTVLTITICFRRSLQSPVGCRESSAGLSIDPLISRKLRANLPPTRCKRWWRSAKTRGSLNQG